MSVREEDQEAGGRFRENHPTISEYISREARQTLVLLCLERINLMTGQEGAATALLAEDLSVSPRTIQRWAAGGAQGSDKNIDKLINRAYQLDPEKTLKIIERDLERHRLHVERVKARGGIPWTPGRRVCPWTSLST